MLKFNNKDTRTTPPCSSVSIVSFEQVNASWELRENGGCSESTQSTITCSKLTIKTLEQGVKYVQS